MASGKAFRRSYTWTKSVLQFRGLTTKAPRRGVHRRKRERRPLPGIMLLQDGSTHAWLANCPDLDMIVTMDDATSAITSIFLCEQEGTASSFCGLSETILTRGLFSSFYTDRGSHYFLTPKAGETVDKELLTQVGEHDEGRCVVTFTHRALGEIDPAKTFHPFSPPRAAGRKGGNEPRIVSTINPA